MWERKIHRERVKEWEKERESVCVRVHVREKERERERFCVFWRERERGTEGVALAISFGALLICQMIRIFRILQSQCSLFTSPSLSHTHTHTHTLSLPSISHHTHTQNTHKTYTLFLEQIFFVRWWLDRTTLFSQILRIPTEIFFFGNDNLTTPQLALKSFLRLHSSFNDVTIYVTSCNFDAKLYFCNEILSSSLLTHTHTYTHMHIHTHTYTHTHLHKHTHILRIKSQRKGKIE